MLNQNQIEQKANHIIDGLSDLSVLETLTVLNAAFRQVINRAAVEKTPELQRPVITINPFLIQPFVRSKIDADPELKACIDGLGERLSCDAIAKLTQEKFGNKRGVGKSTVGRYRQRMNILADLNRKVSVND